MRKNFRGIVVTFIISVFTAILIPTMEVKAAEDFEVMATNRYPYEWDDAGNHGKDRKFGIWSTTDYTSGSFYVSQYTYYDKISTSASPYKDNLYLGYMTGIGNIIDPVSGSDRTYNMHDTVIGMYESVGLFNTTQGRWDVDFNHKFKYLAGYRKNCDSNDSGKHDIFMMTVLCTQGEENGTKMYYYLIILTLKDEGNTDSLCFKTIKSSKLTFFNLDVSSYGSRQYIKSQSNIGTLSFDGYTINNVHNEILRLYGLLEGEEGKINTVSSLAETKVYDNYFNVETQDLAGSIYTYVGLNINSITIKLPTDKMFGTWNNHPRYLVTESQTSETEIVKRPYGSYCSKTASSASFSELRSLGKAVESTSFVEFGGEESTDTAVSNFKQKVFVEKDESGVQMLNGHANSILGNIIDLYSSGLAKWRKNNPGADIEYQADNEESIKGWYCTIANLDSASTVESIPNITNAVLKKHLQKLLEVYKQQALDEILNKYMDSITMGEEPFEYCNSAQIINFWMQLYVKTKSNPEASTEPYYIKCVHIDSYESKTYNEDTDVFYLIINPLDMMGSSDINNTITSCYDSGSVSSTFNNKPILTLTEIWNGTPDTNNNKSAEHFYIPGCMDDMDRLVLSAYSSYLAEFYGSDYDDIRVVSTKYESIRNNAVNQTAQDFLMQGSSGNRESLYNYAKDKLDILPDIVTNENYTLFAPYADELLSYGVAINVYNTGDSGSEDALNQLFSLFNEDLNTILTLNRSLQAEGDNYYYVPMIPFENRSVTMGDNRKHVCNSYDIKQSALYDYVSIISTISLAFEVLNRSEVGQTENWTASDLDKALKSWGQNPDTKNFTDERLGSDLRINVRLIRSVISLGDMCNSWGIDANTWTESISQYYALYEDAIVFRDNELIKGQFSASTSNKNPLGNFFDVEQKQINVDWLNGVAISSHFVPMETNLYDATAVSWLGEDDWITDFYYKYGFYRKALYVSTDSSAVVNMIVSGTKPSTKVATLADLLNYNRDIILYVDPNYYNADQVEDMMNKLDYTAIRNSYNNIQSSDDESKNKTQESYAADVSSWLGNSADLNADIILKTNGNRYYSDTLKNSVSDMDAVPSFANGFTDAYILDPNSIKQHIEDYEYSVAQSYSVVSAIYRHDALFNAMLNACTTDNAIFKSSCATPSMSSMSYSDWLCYMNYVMLANLEAAMINDSASAIDVDSPIFVDIFGNIVTESGIVVIPAAANATLMGDNWSPCTFAFASLYGKSYRIPEDKFTTEFYEWATATKKEKTKEYDQNTGEYITTTYKNKPSVKWNTTGVHEKGSGWFMFPGGSVSGLSLKTCSVSSQGMSAVVQWDIISKNNEFIKTVFYSKIRNDLKTDKIFSYKIVNLITEVLRGAPIENIDYTKEKLDGKQDISKTGVFVAYNLENILNLLEKAQKTDSNGNTTLSMPNLAFVDGVEYIVLYVYKIVFAICVAGMIIGIYKDAVVNKFGLKSIGKFIFTVCLVAMAIAFVPKIISWSYYNANKTLLNNEVSYIAMLNYTKEFDGSEIGVTGITTPESQTKLYLKLDDVSINWWEVAGDVLFSNTFETVSELYDKQFDNHLIAKQKEVIRKGDGLYLDVDEILNSTTIYYNSGVGKLQNKNFEEGGNVVSFVSPYYVILDQLIAEVNKYNADYEISSYTMKVANNGHVITYDVITPFLMSNEFMEDGYDILGLHKLLQDGYGLVPMVDIFTDSDKERMYESLWYPEEGLSEEYIQEKVNDIYLWVRSYVYDNRSILGKVPDEVFLKTLALQISMKYNQEFHIPAGQSLEIISIDNRDLIRMMIGKKSEVYKYYAYSLARFTYEQGGALGCILCGIYAVVSWLAGILKLGLLIVLLILLIINAVFRKILFRQQSKAIEGYILGCGLLAMANYGYAAMLKVTMLTAHFGYGVIVSFAVGILAQIAYLFIIIKIIVIEVKDWKDNGFNEFAAIGQNMSSKLLHIKNATIERMHGSVNDNYKDSRKHVGTGEEETLEDMMERDRNNRQVRAFE